MTKKYLLPGRICLLLVLASIPFVLSAQTTVNELNDTLRALYQKSKLPGFSIAIVHNNKVMYKNGYGYADLATKTPYTPTTIQNIGSVSKTFVAVAIMKAIEMGYFTLGTNINDILPFKVSNPYFPNDPITVQQLATHTSGIIDNNKIYARCYRWNSNDTSILRALLPVEVYDLMTKGPEVDTTLKDFLHSYLAADGKLFSKENFYTSKPGGRSNYSNIGAALAAYLIEYKAGMSFSEFTDKYIFKPLQMTQTGWFLHSVDLRQHATLYSEHQKPFPLYQLVTYPDGGLRTSVDELSKYLMGMIKGANGKSALLSGKLFKEMFTPQFSLTSPPANFDVKSRNKGIFWNIYPTGYIGHDGADPGARASINFNPTTRVGYAFMTNISIDNEALDKEVRAIWKVLENFCNNIK